MTGLDAQPVSVSATEQDNTSLTVQLLVVDGFSGDAAIKIDSLGDITVSVQSILLVPLAPWRFRVRANASRASRSPATVCRS